VRIFGTKKFNFPPGVGNSLGSWQLERELWKVRSCRGDYPKLRTPEG